MAKGIYWLSHVRPSVRVYRRGCCWTDWREIRGLIWKSVVKREM